MQKFLFKTKSLFLIVILINVFFANVIFTQQETSAARYLPLNVGNYYVFIHNHNFFQYSIVTSGITDSSIFEGKLYYLFYGALNGYIRYDSATGNIFQYDNTFSCSFYNHVKQIDSLWASSGNGDNGCNYTPPGRYHCILSGYSVNVLGLQTLEKSFDISLPNNATRSYAKDIGLYYYNNSIYHGSQDIYQLKGCVIKGVVFGDTSLNITYSGNASTQIPKHFNLFQNYPNPFNPSTKIKFDLPTVGKGRDRSVRMIIYDVLGREVATLVNEQLKPGSYEVEWDGSNYASGIYFYQLITEQFTQTKRMVLIK